jgi:hypothetical protein
METRWWLNRAYGALAEVDGLGQQGHVPVIGHLEQVHTSLHDVSQVQISANIIVAEYRIRIRIQIILEMLHLDLYIMNTDPQSWT